MSTLSPLRSRKNTRKLTNEEIEKMRTHDHKMVKGVFRCYEPRGGSMTFSFKKHSGDNIITYTLTDGEIKELPFMVAKHLNKNCYYPKHSHVLDENGKASVQVGKKVHRCSFESLEFQDLEE